MLVKWTEGETIAERETKLYTVDNQIKNQTKKSEREREREREDEVKEEEKKINHEK